MRTLLSLPSFRPALVAISATILLAGCQKTETTEAVTASALTVVQGNYQSVQSGKDLPNPVILRVLNNTGTAMVGIPVTLVVAEGGGTVTPSSGVSDAKGEFSAKWTLGPVADNQLRATVPGVEAVKIYATGIVPTDIVIAQGNAQAAKFGASLPTSIVVRVVGAGNTPMSGITVLFQVVGGGGAISPATAVTNSLGEVTAKWTLGSFIGTQTALVTASTLSPATLTATSLP
jgi:hypothetical protein